VLREHGVPGVSGSAGAPGGCASGGIGGRVARRCGVAPPGDGGELLGDNGKLLIGERWTLGGGCPRVSSGSMSRLAYRGGVGLPGCQRVGRPLARLRTHRLLLSITIVKPGAH